MFNPATVDCEPSSGRAHPVPEAAATVTYLRSRQHLQSGTRH